MKSWMYALLGLAPNVVAWNYAVAQTTDGAEPAPQVVVVRPLGQTGTPPENFEWVSEDGQQHIEIIAQAIGGDCNGPEGEVKVIQLVGGPGATGGDVVVTADVQATGGHGDQKVKQIKVIAKPRADDPDAAQRGWLGVSIEVLSESMAAQMGAQKRGVMINNVVTNSPADKAGVQANDVIVSINGEDVSGDIGPAVELIKAHKPGETINLGILRGGQPLTLEVTLGSRAGLATDHMKNFDWKFEGMPAQVEEQIKTRGKFIMKTPDGELIVKDLGELDDLKNLPHNIRMFVPQAGTHSAQVTVENGQKTIRMNVVKDGSTLGIEQDDGGPITVRRSDDGGQETVATYDNADALKAADQEAYDLYAQAGQGVFVHTDGDGDAQHIIIQGDGDFDWTGDAGQWKVHLEESLAQAKEAYGKAMEELHASLAELKNQGTFDVQRLHEVLNAQQGKAMGQAFAFHTGRAKHRFEVKSDGSIDVSIRKGDSELSQSFKNEADLANRRPDLYEKYEAVKAADQD